MAKFEARTELNGGGGGGASPVALGGSAAPNAPTIGKHVDVGHDPRKKEFVDG